MDPLGKALDRLAKLKAQVADLERFIVLYRELAETEGDQTEGDLSTDSGAEADTVASKPVDNLPVGVGRKTMRAPRTASPGRIVEVIERVMRDVARPMTRGEIVSALDARDVTIPGADKAKYLGTIMWRNRKTFVNIPKAGYWFKSEDYAPAGFKAGDPGLDPDEDGPSPDDLRDAAIMRAAEGGERPEFERAE